MTDDPRLIRWTPQQHYDTACHAIAETTRYPDDPSTQIATQIAIAHSLLGILRQLEIIDSKMQAWPI